MKRSGIPFWIGTDKARTGQTTWSRRRMRLDGQGFFRRPEEDPDSDVVDCEEMDQMLEEFGIIPPRGKQVRVRIQVIGRERADHK